MNIQEILDQIGEDVLSADTKKVLVEAFEDSVTQQTNQRLEAEISAALHKLDEEHYNQLQELLDAIDEDHTQKLIETVEAIDEDHTAKFKQMINRYQRIIKEDAQKFKDQLVNQLSNYIDLYLDETIPANDLQEAVNNKQAQKTLHEIKQLISIDEDFINETIREAVSDGKSQIEHLKTELNEAVKSNIRVNQELKKAQSELILEKATSSFNPDKKNFVIKNLKGKDLNYITENIEYVSKMFDRDDNKQRTILAEDAKKHSKSRGSDTPKSVDKKNIIMENTDQREGAVREYLSSLKGQDRHNR